MKSKLGRFYLVMNRILYKYNFNAPVVDYSVLEGGTLCLE